MGTRSLIGFGFLAILAFVLPLPTRAATANEQYQDCVAEISRDPSGALNRALNWKERSGGAGAEHCAALAEIALKRPSQAAVRLNNLALRTPATEPGEKAALFDQAGNAWLLAGRAEEADEAFSAALKLTPNDADVLIDRARARAMRKDWVSAQADLSVAHDLNRTNTEILVLRASANAALGLRNEAMVDIAAALALEPANADALVERGALKFSGGDKQGARADWQQAIARAPNSAAGATARKYVAEMDAPPPASPAPATPLKLKPPPKSPPAGH